MLTKALKTAKLVIIAVTSVSVCTVGVAAPILWPVTMPYVALVGVVAIVGLAILDPLTTRKES